MARQRATRTAVLSGTAVRCSVMMLSLSWMEPPFAWVRLFGGRSRVLWDDNRPSEPSEATACARQGKKAGTLNAQTMQTPPPAPWAASGVQSLLQTISFLIEICAIIGLVYGYSKKSRNLLLFSGLLLLLGGPVHGFFRSFMLSHLPSLHLK
jgi:hypothetical protein